MPLDQPGSNTANNDSAADWIRQIRQQTRICDEETGVLRNLFKRAKSDGMNTAAMRAAIRASKLDSDEVESGLRDQLRYMAIIHVGVNKEALFDWSDTVTSKTEHEDKLWEADDAGYRAGRHGVKTDDCPPSFPPGSELHVHWLASWHKGQAAIARELGDNVKLADPAKTRPVRAAQTDFLAPDKPPVKIKKPRQPRAYVPGQVRRGQKRRAVGGAAAAH
jgi:ribosome modulation factor/uncharacterized protein (UPF0335 family)